MRYSTMSCRSLPAVLVCAAATCIAAPAAAQCQVQKLTASDMAERDQFGDCVAISGDLAVIGASREDDSGDGGGAVYVFRYQYDGDSGSWRWIEEAKLLAGDGASMDLFGWSVAVDACAVQGEVIVVGSYLDDDEYTSSGSAYVFRYVGDQWIEEAKLTAAPYSGLADEFGRAVAVSDDCIIIGAARDDDGGADTGSAFIFRHTGSIWVLQAKLNAPDAATYDRFGSSVSIDARALDGEVAIIGAPLADQVNPPLSNTGAAYVFRYTDPGGGYEWALERKLTAIDADAGDKFGHAASLSEDIALIGSPLDDQVGANAGSAYVFYYAGASWDDGVKLTADDPAADDQFGSAVAIFTDAVNGDIAVIGAPYADDSGETSGAAYVFRYSGAWWQQGEILTLDGEANDQLGISVAAEADFLLIGASMDDDVAAGINAGSAYVFTSEAGDCEDCNQNMLLDVLEIAGDPDLDCNVNGVLDVCEIDIESTAPGGPFFCTEDCDPDCNSNGIPDECDISSGESQDINANDIPDECEDCNNNGIPDDLDIAQGTSQDCNANAVPDECDIADQTSTDCNSNDIPDECEIDAESSAPGGPFYCTEDCDPDCNNNGIPDECDIADETSADCNTNGVPDECDIADETSPDENGNGIPDECEDCDGNGWPDFLDIAMHPELDCNTNDVLDVCEIDVNSTAPGGPFYCTENCDPDCNNNGIPDDCDIIDQTSVDCNDNGIPDECEIDAESSAPGGPFFCTEDCDPDCNDNGIPDSCDIADETSEDADADGIPDECQDCNNNGVLDSLDISSGTSQDCNDNGIPDECDIDPDDPDGDGIVSGDCQPNGIPDECDIAEGGFLDIDDDGVPDICEDCNDNGEPDPWEILYQGLEDCNDNWIPDVCEIDAQSQAPGGPFFCTENCDPDCNNNGIPDECDIADGTSLDENANGIPDECEFAPGDINEDGAVNVADLLLLLAAWGSCPDPPDPCPADLDDNGVVDVSDLLILLGNWG